MNDISYKSQTSNNLGDKSDEIIYYGQLEHPITKNLFVTMRKNLLIGIEFGIDEEEFLIRTRKKYNSKFNQSIRRTEGIINQLRNYLNGQQIIFDVLVDINFLTDFQQLILNATQLIPRGEVATYAEIARQIGKPKAVRAAGQALGRNPVPIVIPCHRVISSNGSLGGYSGGGGVDTKSKLLQLEGVLL